MGLTNGAILDDLKTNFRKWEFDSDNQKDTNRLATILMSRHGVSFDEAYKYAKHWTGYDYEDNQKDTNRLATILMSRHGVSFDEAYEYAKHWTGYDYEENENEFILLAWPDSQTYMEEDWFEDEAVYHPNESGAYFIPKNRI